MGYAGKGNSQQAVKDYSEAISLDRNNALAYCNRGLIHTQQNEPGRAISDFVESLALNPSNATTKKAFTDLRQSAILRYVPVDCDALFVLNLRQLVESPAFRSAVMEKLQTIVKENEIQILLTALGLDLFKDFELLVVAAKTDSAKSLVIVAHGRYNSDKFHEVSKKAYKPHTGQFFGLLPYTFYENIDQKMESTFMGLVNQSTLVFSPSKDSIVTAFARQGTWLPRSSCQWLAVQLRAA